jgi:hypothetical protein
MKTLDYIALTIGTFMCVAHTSLGNYKLVLFYALLTAFTVLPTFLKRK